MNTIEVRTITLSPASVTYLRGQLSAKALDEAATIAKASAQRLTSLEEPLPATIIKPILQDIGLKEETIESFLGRLGVTVEEANATVAAAAAPEVETPAEDPTAKTADDAAAETSTEEEGEESDDEAPAPVDLKPTEVPAPQPLSNIIRGLANTLSVKGMLGLTIAKLAENEILVTIQHAPSGEENRPAPPPVQVKGDPDEIDAKLVEVLEHYVPACDVLIKTADQIAKDVVAAADKAKAAQAKRTAAATPKPKTGTLTIKLKPKDAKLEVKDSSGKAVTVVAAKRETLPVGKYTITVSKDGFDSKTESVEVAQFKTCSPSIELEKSAQVDMFATAK